jgi:glycine/D-amino acid oxidase-like deaminating enzyme
MTPEILIVGQGLAGSLLAWELERRGLPFALADAGHERSASYGAAAGIVNPITGQRLVKTWHAETLLPLAREAYREIGDTLGTAVWHDLRVRRIFADERERGIFARKSGHGDLAPFAGEGDSEGFWIEGAARVDLRRLLRGLRARWIAQGRLTEGSADLPRRAGEFRVVVDCSGLATTARSEFGFVPWEFSKGEVLEIAVDGLDPAVVLNRRHWVMPAGDSRAWVGATHEPGLRDSRATEAGRTLLETSARELLGGPFAVAGHFAGVRVTLPDKRPAVGRHPTREELGVINGLGAKGVLLAPWLAQVWAAHLEDGAAFPAEIDVRRFWRG